MTIERTAPPLPRWIQWLDRRAAGIPGILFTAIWQFFATRAVEASASIAYYFLFSLFPLLIFLVVVGSYFLEEGEVKHEIVIWLTNFFPTASDFIEQNLDVIIAQRRSAGITAVIGLLWAGSGAFNVLARNIDRAWFTARPRSFVSTRLVAFAMISVLVMLLFVSLFLSTAVSLLPLAERWLDGLVTDHNPLLAFLRTTLSPLLLTLLMFTSLYRWIPNADVHWSEAFWGGVVATLGWRLAISGFGWYLTSGLTNFQVVYGSLGTVIVLLLWIFISSLITLFGAHLSAAIAYHRRQVSAHPDRGHPSV